MNNNLNLNKSYTQNPNIVQWFTQNKDKVKAAAKILFLLKLRVVRKILRILQEGELSVTDIYVKARIDQPTASAYLNKLQECQVVKSYRSGKHIYYSINQEKYQRITEIITWFNDVDLDGNVRESYDPINPAPSIYPKLQTAGAEI